MSRQTNYDSPFFTDLLPKLLQKYGRQISTGALMQESLKAKLPIPSVVQKNKVERGIIDLSTFASNHDLASIPTKINPTKVALVASDNDVEEDVEESEIYEEEPAEHIVTDDELLTEIKERFDSLDHLSYAFVKKIFRAAIVSGNAGIGKTYNLESALQSALDSNKIDTFTHVRGMVRATGIYRLLWDHREKGQVLVLDDADGIFDDEIALNLLKGALDTSKHRWISWRSEKVFKLANGSGGEEDGEESIPNEFEFNGSIIFVTNLDFPSMIARGGKLVPHLKALMSRSHYLDLYLGSKREVMIHIKNVVATTDMLYQNDITPANGEMILSFMEEFTSRLRELSLRTVLKLGEIARSTDGKLAAFRSLAKALTLNR